jgi:uncharacterized protein YbjT (DUF2867 family)
MATALVVGGTGKTGRRVAQRLRARGLPIRIGSPSGSRRSRQASSSSATVSSPDS